METFAPAMLQSKSALELFQMRKRVVNDLQTHAEGAAGRDLTASERDFEERGETNLKRIDDALEASLRGDPFERYNGLGAQRLSERDMAAVDWFKSAIAEKNPAGFTIESEEKRDFSMSQPGLEYRSLWEQRDTLKSTATQALPVSVWPNFVLHLVEQTPVLRAGATLITTDTGEDLQIPKSTAFQTAALTAEGGQITESDPTLGVVTLKSYKYAAFWQVSRELETDSPANLIDALSRGAATSLALSYGAHLATGTGTGQPQGYTVGATVGAAGPTGTSTSFGSQATAGQGTDLVLDLYGSIAEPYLLSPSVAVLGRNATFTMFKKYREGSTNRPMLDMAPRKAGASVDLLGEAGYVDPHAPAMAANAKSVAFGDWSRFFVRMVRGVRVERSEEFAFQHDLVSFRAIVRLDGALVDLNAVKTFQHSAT
jgi:HK97 family phage major capsid protein